MSWLFIIMSGRHYYGGEFPRTAPTVKGLTQGIHLEISPLTCQLWFLYVNTVNHTRVRCGKRFDVWRKLDVVCIYSVIAQCANLAMAS